MGDIVVNNHNKIAVPSENLKKKLVSLDVAQTGLILAITNKTGKFKALVDYFSAQGYLKNPPDYNSLLKRDENNNYNKEFVEAVKNFQKSVGLEETGNINAQTIGMIVNTLSFKNLAEAKSFLLGFKSTFKSVDVGIFKDGDKFKVKFLGDSKFSDLNQYKVNSYKESGLDVVSLHFDNKVSTAGKIIEEQLNNKDSDLSKELASDIESAEKSLNDSLALSDELAFPEDTELPKPELKNEYESEIYNYAKTLKTSDELGQSAPIDDVSAFKLAKGFDEFVKLKTKKGFSELKPEELYKLVDVYKKKVLWSTLSKDQLKDEFGKLKGKLEDAYKKSFLSNVTLSMAKPYENLIAGVDMDSFKYNASRYDRELTEMSLEYVEFLPLAESMDIEIPNIMEEVDRKVYSNSNIINEAFDKVGNARVAGAYIKHGSLAAYWEQTNVTFEGVGRGIVDAAIASYEGVKNILTDPKKFAKDMYKVGEFIVSDPNKFIEQMEKQLDEALSTDSGKANLAGQAIFMLASLPVQAEAFNAVSKTAQATKLTYFAGKTVNVSSKLVGKLGVNSIKAIQVSGKVVWKGIKKLPKVDKTVEMAIKTAKTLKNLSIKGFEKLGTKIENISGKLKNLSDDLKTMISSYMEAVKSGNAEKIAELGQKIEVLVDKVDKTRIALQTQVKKAIELAKEGVKKVKELDQNIRVKSGALEKTLAEKLDLPKSVQNLIGKDNLRILRSDMLPPPSLISGLGKEAADEISFLMKQAQKVFPDDVVGQFRFLENNLSKLGEKSASNLKTYLGTIENKLPIISNFQSAELLLKGTTSKDIKFVEKILDQAKKSTSNKMGQLRFIEKKLAELKPPFASQSELKALEEYLNKTKSSWFPDTTKIKIPFYTTQPVLKADELKKFSGVLGNELLESLDNLDSSIRAQLLKAVKNNPKLLKNLEGVSSKELEGLVKVFSKNEHLNMSKFLSNIETKTSKIDIIKTFITLDEKLNALLVDSSEISKELSKTLKNIMTELENGTLSINISPKIITNAGTSKASYNNGLITLTKQDDLTNLLHVYKHHQSLGALKKLKGSKLNAGLLAKEGEALKLEAFSKFSAKEKLPKDLDETLKKYLAGDKKAFEDLAQKRGVNLTAKESIDYNIGLRKTAPTSSEAISEFKGESGLLSFHPEEEVVWKNIEPTDGLPSPQELAKMKGKHVNLGETQELVGASGFDHTIEAFDIKGASMEDIIGRIPPEAKLRELHKIEGSVGKGFEYAWKDKNSNAVYRVRFHEADPKAPAGSNSREGWIVRIEKNVIDPETKKITSSYMDGKGNFALSRDIANGETNIKKVLENLSKSEQELDEAIKKFTPVKNRMDSLEKAREIALSSGDEKKVESLSSEIQKLNQQYERAEKAVKKSTANFKEVQKAFLSYKNLSNDTHIPISGNPILVKK